MRSQFVNILIILISLGLTSLSYAKVALETSIHTIHVKNDYFNFIYHTGEKFYLYPQSCLKSHHKTLENILESTPDCEALASLKEIQQMKVSSDLLQGGAKASDHACKGLHNAGLLPGQIFRGGRLGICLFGDGSMISTGIYGAIVNIER